MDAKRSGKTECGWFGRPSHRRRAQCPRSCRPRHQHAAEYETELRAGGYPHYAALANYSTRSDVAAAITDALTVYYTKQAGRHVAGTEAEHTDLRPDTDAELSEPRDLARHLGQPSLLL